MGGTVGFINVSRSNKYTCRVTKNCAFKLLYDLENSLHYYPENPGNYTSPTGDSRFQNFPGVACPRTPLDGSRLRREIAPPQLQSPRAATAKITLNIFTQFISSKFSTSSHCEKKYANISIIIVMGFVYVFCYLKTLLKLSNLLVLQ